LTSGGSICPGSTRLAKSHGILKPRIFVQALQCGLIKPITCNTQVGRVLFGWI
jgi:hypothetical protein